MTRMRWLAPTVGAAALSFFAQAAAASPVAGWARSPGADAGASSGVQRVAYRQCWRERGKRHCRHVDGPPSRLPEAYYNYAPNTFPTLRPPWVSRDAPYYVPSPY